MLKFSYKILIISTKISQDFYRTFPNKIFLKSLISTNFSLNFQKIIIIFIKISIKLTQNFQKDFGNVELPLDWEAYDLGIQTHGADDRWLGW